MNGKTSKLIRKLAKTNPYAVDNMEHMVRNEEETKYSRSKMSPGTKVMLPGVRLTTKLLKKFYKQGHFNTDDIRAELAKFERETVSS